MTEKKPEPSLRAAGPPQVLEWRGGVGYWETNEEDGTHWAIDSVRFRPEFAIYVAMWDAPDWLADTLEHAKAFVENRGTNGIRRTGFLGYSP